MKDYKFSSYGELNTYLHEIHDVCWKDTLAYKNARCEMFRSKRTLRPIIGFWDLNEQYQTVYGQSIRAELVKEFLRLEGFMPKFKEGVEKVL